VSVKRLKNFLKNEELDENSVVHDQSSGKNNGYGSCRTINTYLTYVICDLTSSLVS